jgi:ubiquinone biosynthesis protein
MPNNQIYFIDFGMMKYIGSVFSGVLGDMLLKIMLGDINGLVNLLVSSKMAPGDVDVEKLRTDLERLYVKSYESKKDSSIGACLEQMMYLFRGYRMKLPGDYALLIKSFIEIEGTIRQLHPKFDMAEYTKKYLANASTLTAVGMRKFEELKITAESVMESLGALPSAISDFTKTVSDGTIKVDVKVETLDALSLELDRISNRIIVGLVLVAILIGSSLISITDKGPLWLGFPIFGIIGFMLAMILGFWMIFGIIRKAGI